MGKIRVMIVDDNADYRNTTSTEIQDDNFEVVATAGDGRECLEILKTTEVDLLLLDIVMPVLDGYGVINALRNNEFMSRPKVFMVSNLMGEGFISKALQNGADYYFIKPVDIDILKERAVEFLNAKITTQVREVPNISRRAVTHTLEEKIANIFISVGIPAHIKGYQFLRDAIKLVVNEPSMINNITKKLYPTIAETFETSSSKVERAIRHAIEVAWSRGKIENINKLFGFKVYSVNDKPTNGEFIALVADKLMIERVN